MYKIDKDIVHKILKNIVYKIHYDRTILLCFA